MLCCLVSCSNGKYTTTSERGEDGKPLTPVSGTSFAAPYTAGALALALQLHRQNLRNPAAQGIAALQGLPAEERDKGVVQRFVNDALVRGALQLDAFGINRAESSSKQGAGERGHDKRKTAHKETYSVELMHQACVLHVLQQRLLPAWCARGATVFILRCTSWSSTPECVECLQCYCQLLLHVPQLAHDYEQPMCC
jgi:hypothetical protein